jgi:hypothetical protein
VKKPGVKLAPAGITLNQLVAEFYCGGMAEGHRLAGYLPGGASGGILPASLADEPLDFGSLEASTAALSAAMRWWCFPTGRSARHRPQPDGLLRPRILRPMHALPGGHGKAGTLMRRRSGTPR